MSGSAAAPWAPARVIQGDRLQLVPLGLADAAAIVHGHRPAGARWTDGYPTERTLVAAGQVVAAEGRDGAALGPYRSYQIVRIEDDTVIGDCGFLGPPDELGEIHVGFGVADVRQGHRFADEAVRLLIDWARQRPEVNRIVGEAARTDIASLRVLQRAGMRRSGSDADCIYFEA